MEEILCDKDLRDFNRYIIELPSIKSVITLYHNPEFSGPLKIFFLEIVGREENAGQQHNYYLFLTFFFLSIFPLTYVSF